MPHVDHEVKQAQQHQAPPGTVQYERAGPKVLVNRKIDVPKPSQAEADQAGDGHEARFFHSADVVATQPLSREATEQRRGDRGDDGEQTFGIADILVQFARDDLLVDKVGQRLAGGEVARTVFWHRNETQRSPVADEQPQHPNQLGAPLGVRGDQCGEHVSQTDPAKHTGVAHLAPAFCAGQVPAQQSVVQNAQQHERQSTLNEMAMQICPTVAFGQAVGDRVNCGYSGDEQKQREDQIVRLEPVPFGVLQPISQPVARLH